MSFEDQMKAVTAQIRSYRAVAVLGAGLSGAHYPMAPQLPSLLWYAIDSNPPARAGLAAELGKADASAKELIGDEESAVEAGWRVLESNREVRLVFQQAFARLDADREPTPAHYALARLVRARLVEYVISFNWDSALERAHEQLFGTSLIGQSDLLAKPHGDVATPQEDWILPHQTGAVPESVLAQIADLNAQGPRVLLIVGYSGSDETVLQQLLVPAERRWPVAKVGPAVSGPGALTGPADDVLTAMADSLNAPVDIPGWRWVGFTRSRDLRAALMGYRLGPQDVRACPELPAATMIAERIRQAGFAAIAGDSGAGKSITAFHSAFRLNREGWGTIELSQPGVASTDAVRTFESLSGPVVAIVDDAQAIAPEVIRALERAVSEDHGVILIVTDRVPGQELVRLVAAHAVRVLAHYCSERADLVEPLVRELDDRVGLGMGRESYPQRLKAAESSEFPWQFMYVLGGGERRIADALRNMADEGEADLLFGMLAAEQVLSLDAAIAKEDLLARALDIDRDERWLVTGLSSLAAHRLVVNRESGLRTPHMRIADRALLALCRDAANPRWRTFVSFLRSRLLDPTLPLQGKLWLLRSIDQADPLRYGSPYLLLDREAANFLVDACLAASMGPDRNISAYLLWEVGWWKALTTDMAERISAALPGWIGEVTSDDVFGIQWVLAGLRSDFPALHGWISSAVPPEDVARQLQETGSPGAGSSWGRLLQELAHAEGIDTQAWATRFQDAVDTDRVEAWVRSGAATSSLQGNADLADNLAFLAPRLAAAVVGAMTPALIDRLQNNVAAAAQDLVPWAFGLFLVAGSDEGFQGFDEDSRRLREAVIDMVNATDWEAVGRSLATAPLHELDQIDLLTFSLHDIAPAAYTRMVSSVSLDELDRITEGHWLDLSRIEHLVISLGENPDHEPARSWVHRHLNQIQRVPTRVVAVAPQEAVEVVRRGGRIELQVQKGLRWGWCAEALNALVAVDREVALAVVNASRLAILEGLVLTHPNMVEDLEDFIAALDAVNQSILVDLLEALETETVRHNWSERLSGSTEEAAAVNLLIDRSLQASGAIRTAAQALRDASDETDRKHPPSGGA